MANSTTNLDLLSSGLLNKEVTQNALNDAGSPATLFGRRAGTCTGLVIGLYGGTVMANGVPTQVYLPANTTLTLTASSTNYVECTAAGVVSSNTTGFTVGRIPLHIVVTSASAVTAWTDLRGWKPSPYIVPVEYIGVLPASGVLRLHVFTETVTFFVNIAGSKGIAEATAAAQADIDLRRSTNNGSSYSSVGTVRYAIATSPPTYIMASATTFNPGDALKILAPGSPDASLANIAFSLRGLRDG